MFIKMGGILNLGRCARPVRVHEPSWAARLQALTRWLLWLLEFKLSICVDWDVVMKIWMIYLLYSVKSKIRIICIGPMVADLSVLCHMLHSCLEAAYYFKSYPCICLFLPHHWVFILAHICMLQIHLLPYLLITQNARLWIECNVWQKKNQNNNIRQQQNGVWNYGCNDSYFNSGSITMLCSMYFGMVIWNTMLQFCIG